MSRYRRKHQFGTAPPRSTWWALRDRGWWIGVLFAIGSALFALGAFPAYASEAGGRADSVTFFTGSVFFTWAAFLTYREAVDAGERQRPAGKAARRRRRFFVFEPGRIDWWATAIQLLGTLFFNLSTGDAISANLGPRTAYQTIWVPDAFGSACFLLASALAWGEACHGWAAWKPRSWAWWITLVNLLGSVAFGVSATAGYINPATGRIQDAARSNLGTFTGALCFLAGAILLLPERAREREEGLSAGVGPSGEKRIDPPGGGKIAAAPPARGRGRGRSASVTRGEDGTIVATTRPCSVTSSISPLSLHLLPPEAGRAPTRRRQPASRRCHYTCCHTGRCRSSPDAYQAPPCFTAGR